MTGKVQFRYVLPIAQTFLAALFGGIGLWERNRILSQPFFGDNIGWDTTLRFHVWPWPFKLAAITNMPAFLLGTLPEWLIEQFWPQPEIREAAVALFFVPILWYIVGVRLDRLSALRGAPYGSRAAWAFLLIFATASVFGASALDRYMGFLYVGFIPYGIAVWVATPFALRLMSPKPKPTGGETPA